MSFKKLLARLKIVEQLLYDMPPGPDMDADPNDQSPEDMNSHLSGLALKELEPAIALVEQAIAEGPEKSLETLADEQGITGPQDLDTIIGSAPDGLEDFVKEKHRRPDWRALADKAADIIYAYRRESECCVMCKESRWGVHKEGCEAYGVLQAIRAAETAERVKP